VIKRSVVALVVALTFVVPTGTEGATTAEQNARSALLARINAERGERGLPALTEWLVITDEAQQHSEDMGSRAVPFGHAGFAGRTQRIRDAGTGIGYICENVAFVAGSRYRKLTRAVKALYKLWENSQDHNRCMFDFTANTTWAGVGIRKKGSRWWATFLPAADSSPASP
jgi:uncharacterized protein YkwD